MSSTKLRSTYDLLLVSLGAILVVLSVAGTKQEMPDTWKQLSNHLGIATVVGVMEINAIRFWGIDSTLLYAVGIFLICPGLVCLAVGWFRQLASFCRQEIPVLVLGAFVVSHAFGFFDALPRDAAALVVVVYPLFSFLFLELCSSSLCGAVREGQVASAAAEASLPQHHRNKYFKQLRALTLCLIFIEILCGALLRSRWAHGGIGYSPQTSVVYTYLLSALIGCAFLLIVRRSRTTAESALIIGGVGLVLSAAAAACFAYLPARLLQPMVTGLYSALMVYMMALIALWRTDGDYSDSTCAGVFMLLYALASGITNSVIPLFFSYQRTMPEQYLVPIGITAGLVVSLGICLALFAMLVVQRDSFAEAMKLAGIGMRGGTAKDIVNSSAEDEYHERAMNKVAIRYALTERECETASLLARGYTAKRVAEELTVAPSTVQGYSKAIYRKMGIHRKDELIEVVNQAEHALGNRE